MMKVAEPQNLAKVFEEAHLFASSDDHGYHKYNGAINVNTRQLFDSQAKFHYKVGDWKDFQYVYTANRKQGKKADIPKDFNDALARIAPTKDKKTGLTHDLYFKRIELQKRNTDVFLYKNAIGAHSILISGNHDAGLEILADENYTFNGIQIKKEDIFN